MHVRTLPTALVKNTACTSVQDDLTHSVFTENSEAEALKRKITYSNRNISVSLGFNDT